MAYREKLDDLYSLLKRSIIDEMSYHKYQSNLETLRMDVIEKYLPNNCVGFLRQLYPHKTRIDLLEHQFYNAISEPIKIKNVFLNFIQKIITPPSQLPLRSSLNTFIYQPTCIDFNESDELIKDIEINRARKGLVDNFDHQSSIQKNVDFLVVNSTGPEDVISAGILKITEVDSYESNDSSLKDSNKFTERKEVSFIDSRKALGDING